jgi:hypothetical protein
MLNSMETDTTTRDAHTETSWWRNGWRTLHQLWGLLFRDLLARKWLVGQLTLIYLILSLVPVWLFVDNTNVLLTEVVWWGTVLAINLLTTLLGIAVLRVVAVPVGERSLVVSLWWVVPRCLLVVVTSMAWIGLLLTGVLVLIVPALALLGYTLLTFVVGAQEDVWGVRALVRSIELVRGAWWSVCVKAAAAMCGFIILAVVPIVMVAMVMGYAVLTRDTMLESVLVYVMLVISALAEAVLGVVWARLGLFLYEERVAVAVPFEVGNATRIVNMTRTAAVVGWLLPLLAVVIGIGYLVQTPGAYERVLLYLSTGI